MRFEKRKKKFQKNMRFEKCDLKKKEKRKEFERKEFEKEKKKKKRKKKNLESQITHNFGLHMFEKIMMSDLIIAVLPQFFITLVI